MVRVGKFCENLAGDLQGPAEVPPVEPRGPALVGPRDEGRLDVSVFLLHFTCIGY